MRMETWTAERVEQLRNFVVTGLTCNQIAAQIGVTRNAVIGKIHRLGLSSVRPPGASTRARAPRAHHPRASRSRPFRHLFCQDAAATKVVAASSTFVDSAQPCSLFELAKGKCRWPLGDTAGDCGAADFIFCGNEAIAGFSYCAGHARMAYRPLARRRA